MAAAAARQRARSGPPQPLRRSATSSVGILNAYDIIGDVHGQASKLTALLGRMGYRQSGAVWGHPGRVAVFVGDLIDRGPQQCETIDLVRDMVAAGTALMVMGNHEYNAIAWATPDPQRPGDYLRTHCGSKGVKNAQQHKAFLEAVASKAGLHAEYVEWFKTLPLWLDLDGLRIVHACWDHASINLLAAWCTPGNTLTHDLLVASASESAALERHEIGDPTEYHAVETVLKGPEVELRTEAAYRDKDGHLRFAARYAWYRPDAPTFPETLVLPAGLTTPSGDPYVPPHEPLEPVRCTPYTDDVPLFVGHYWRTGTPTLLGRHVACVDYSAGLGEHPLVAYRWNGERTLSPANFVL